MARLAPAHVFQILQGILLAVEVIRTVARLGQQMAFFQHGGYIGVVVLFLVLHHDAGGPLEGQGVDGDILRVQRDGLPQTMLKALHRVPRQARDEVHVDVLVACFPGVGVAVQNVLCRVLAANTGQHLVREGLGVDGDAGGPVLLDDRQLFGVGAVRAARLHGVLHHLREVKVLPHGAHQLAQLVRREAGGGAAANVDAAEGQARFVSLYFDLLHLPAEAVHIGLHHLAVPVQIAADKAAIAAPGGAERDTDIEAVGPGHAARL